MSDDILYDLLPDLPRETRAFIRLAQRVGRLEMSLGDLTAEVSELRESLLEFELRFASLHEQTMPEEIYRRIRVLEGALEETINRIEELRQPATTKPKPEPALYTAGGHRSHARQFRGVYCRNCAKTLDRKQAVFCSRKCAKRWRDQHPGEVPQPRLTIEEALETTVVAGVGVRDNGKEQ